MKQTSLLNLSSYEQLQDPTKEELLCLAPRGHAKSTCTSVNFPLWLIGNNHNIRILIASNTVTQANLFLREITSNIEMNDKYKEVFGELKPPGRPKKWTDVEIIVDRDQKLKDATVATVGAGSAIIGRRADVIICDDIVDEDNAKTEHQRESLSTWFYKVLLPVLDPGGKLVVIGTRWHYKDLYSDLLKKSYIHDYSQKRGKELILEGIEEAEWHSYYFKAIMDDNTVLWPERYDRTRLDKLKKDMGTIIFNTQYQNDPSGIEGILLKTEWLKYYDKAPEDLQIVQGIDLAISERKEADFFVICTIGRDENNNIFVLSFFKAKLDFPSQLKAIETNYSAFHPQKIAIESNAYQRALTQWLRVGTNLPIVEVKTVKDKVSRMLALSPHFENGRIKIRKDMQDFIAEFIQFPKGPHDDMLDALAFAVDTLPDIGPRFIFDFIGGMGE